MENKLEHGIILVCTGHPYYGRFAYNLAVSIKAVEDFPICLLYNGQAISHLAAHQLEVFDYISQIDENIKANTMCKLHATKYTPFEKTVVLDADTLWLQTKTPSEFFEEVKDVHFASITEGKESDVNKNYFFWADPGEIKQQYKCKTEIHQWRSEVMYFDEEGKKVLERALEICETHKLKSVSNFAHACPDELGINIATAEMGILPHIYKWNPSYWPNMSGGIFRSMREIESKHYLISFGSNRASGDSKKVYGSITGYAFMKMKRQNVFPLIEKKSFLPNIRNAM